MVYKDCPRGRDVDWYFLPILRIMLIFARLSANISSGSFLFPLPSTFHSPGGKFIKKFLFLKLLTGASRSTLINVTIITIIRTRLHLSGPTGSANYAGLRPTYFFWIWHSLCTDHEKNKRDQPFKSKSIPTNKPIIHKPETGHCI